MLPDSGWLYLGAYSVWDSRYRLTVPPSAFDEYEILLRDRGGWWIYDENDKAIQISNWGSTEVTGAACYADLSKPGDGSKTRYFTIPEEFRYEDSPSVGQQESTNKDLVPKDLQPDHGTKVHFISATSLISGDVRSLYLFTCEQLEEIAQGGGLWANDPKSIARLQDSEVSHLVAEDSHPIDQPLNSPAEADEIPSSETPLEQRLDIESGDVPTDFSIKYATVEIEDVPPDIFSEIDLKYLLVRYGVSETTKRNPAENPELVKILNKEVNVESTYSAADQTIVAEVPFCVHNRHAAEFKFFVDVSDPGLLSRIESALSNSNSCSSASISDSLEDRVYLVHRDFPTTETNGGFVNNVVYPK